MKQAAVVIAFFIIIITGESLSTGRQIATAKTGNWLKSDMCVYRHSS